MKLFLKQKLVRIGAVAVLAVLIIFGLAMMGSVLGAKPKSVPIMLAVLDQPADLPVGGQLALGETVRKQITGNGQIPVEWRIAASEEEALAALDSQEAYGALVIPADFSSGVLSIQSAEPKPAVVKLYVNEGMNAQGTAAARNVLGQISKTVGLELSRQVLEQVGKTTEQIPVGAAQSLLTPFTAQEIVVHPVGMNNGGGNAPNMLTQIMWMGSLVISICLFFASQAARAAGGRWGVAAGQALAGLVLTAGASGFLVWMASSWYGMEIADLGATWLFLWLAAAAFFLMQSALLSWLGMPAIALLVLLLFFSLPVIGMAPEFMPQATQDWLYSWTPFRYAASGLRSQLYFGGGSDGMSLAYGVLWGIAGVSLAVLLASGLKKRKAPAGAAAAAPSAAG